MYKILSLFQKALFTGLIAKTAKVSQERLKSLLSYSSDTGLFTWLVNKGKARVGDIAGKVNPKDGYLYIGIDNKHYPAHRLAILYTKGYFPPQETDHINGIRLDNRCLNLREVTPSQNQHNKPMYSNNTTGFKGVVYIKANKNYTVQIQVKGQKRIRITGFKTPEEASEKYQELVKQLHGRYSRV
jgi:hypothetical protein